MKTVYQTDANGYFVAPVPADPSPLEPGVWLIPAGAVEAEPPAVASGQVARMVNGAWSVEDLPPPPAPPGPPAVGSNQRAVLVDGVWVIEDLPDPPQPEPPAIPMSEKVNAERDRRLSSDFTFNGVAFQRDTKSLQRITGAATLAGFAIAQGAQPGNLRWSNPDRDFMWIASDNSTVTMDAQTAFAFGAAAARVETDLIFAAANLRAMDPIPEDYADDKWWV